MIDAALDTVRGAIDRCGADAGQPAGTRVQLRLRVDGPTGQVVSAWALGAKAHLPRAHCAVQAVTIAKFETTIATGQTIDVTLTTH